MTKMQEFLNLVTTLTGKKVIIANQQAPKPKLPIVTMTSINVDRSIGVSNRVHKKTGSAVTTTRTKKVYETIQLDFYDVSDSASRVLAEDFMDTIKIDKIEEIIRNGFNIVGMDNIKSLPTFLESEYTYRQSCDIIIEYTQERTFGITQMESVEVNDNEIVVGV